MNEASNCYWNEKVVMAHLECAAAIHRRLPEVKVQGYPNLWPITLKDDWQRHYDAVHGKSRLGPPMPPEVSYHEEVMEWLRWLDPFEQQIVWMRANRVPWKILEAEFGIEQTTLRRRRNRCLIRIAATLVVRNDAASRAIVPDRAG